MPIAFSNDLFYNWYQLNENRIHSILKTLIDINTTTPYEEKAYDYLFEYLNSANFEVRFEPLHEKLKSNASFTDHPNTQLSGNRKNIRGKLRDINNHEITTLINTHFDVVPETIDFPDAFISKEKEGYIIGRGACDTKNNIIMCVEAIRFLLENNIQFSRNIYLDLVIEEEIGGNGTLSTIMHGITADEVINLEPTDLDFYRGHRGCLTFEIEVNGKAVHMGGDTTGQNAIILAFEIITELQKLEKRLLREAKLNKDFNKWSKPLQMNIGKIVGGEWSGSVPEKCVITGDLGFLPTYSIEEIKFLIEQCCISTGNPWIAGNYKLRFNGLQNDAYIISEHTALVKNFKKTLSRHGRKAKKSFGWKVSCDARHFNKSLGLPVIIFGSGSLNDAHSAQEKINTKELKAGCHILADYFSYKC